MNQQYSAKYILPSFQTKATTVDISRSDTTKKHPEHHVAGVKATQPVQWSIWTSCFQLSVNFMGTRKTINNLRKNLLTLWSQELLSHMLHSSFLWNTGWLILSSIQLTPYPGKIRTVYFSYKSWYYCISSKSYTPESLTYINLAWDIKQMFQCSFYISNIFALNCTHQFNCCRCLFL